LRVIHASGAYGALKPNAALATWHSAGGLYRVDHASTEFLQVYTNTVPGGYFRSPGAVQTFFALESHTDIVARALGIDPAEFRVRNLLVEGEEDALGQRLRDVRFTDVLKGALDRADWATSKRRVNVGRGIALYGRHIGGDETGLILTAEADGIFTLVSPIPDQGAGTHTVLRQLLAEELGVPVEQVRVVVGDTDSAPPDSGGARASRVTYVSSRAAVRVCGELVAQLAAHAAHMLECVPEDVAFRGGQFYLRRDPHQHLSLHKVIARAGPPLTVSVTADAPYPEDVTYMSAQLAEVEVDVETGKLNVRRFVTAHDVGTIINPLTHQGQIDGGVMMGIGQALTEELIIEEGKIVNGSLSDYKLPTSADIPRLETVLVRSDGSIAPHEVKAIGEFANNTAPAAIANAVADAVGVRLFELPISAEKIYRALRTKTDAP
jgi:xanthine dehydrogenase molybdenum-binding subunit